MNVGLAWRQECLEHSSRQFTSSGTTYERKTIMATQSTNIKAFPLKEDSSIPHVKLYKVYLHTQDDPAVQELIVAARNREEAGNRALGHVKKSNPHKGSRTPSQAIKATRVFGVRETGTEACVAIHRIPLDVFSNAVAAANG